LIGSISYANQQESDVVGLAVKVICVIKKKKKVKVNFFPVDVSVYMKEYVFPCEKLLN